MANRSYYGWNNSYSVLPQVRTAPLAMENGSQLTITTAVSQQLQQGIYRHNGMDFPVRVLDCRKVWGRVDLLVSPVGGTGEKWVEQSAVKF